MSEIVQRAAREVEAIIGTHCSSCEAQLSSEPADIVRAVLKAIREPSEEMLEAAWDVGSVGDSGGTERAMPDDEFRAMIDAALQE